MAAAQFFLFVELNGGKSLHLNPGINYCFSSFISMYRWLSLAKSDAEICHTYPDVQAVRGRFTSLLLWSPGRSTGAQSLTDSCTDSVDWVDIRQRVGF